MSVDMVVANNYKPLRAPRRLIVVALYSDLVEKARRDPAMSF